MLSRWSRSVQASRSRPTLPRRPRRFRPLCEVLEDRRVLATVTDSGDSGPGTLRQAILDAAPGEMIAFSLSTPVISITSGPLVIDKALIIDGFTQTGTGTDPRVQVDGGGVSELFVVNTGGVTIQGLSITRSFGSGIALNGAAGPHNNAVGSFIIGNWIGLDLIGDEAGNAEDGVHIHSDNNTIRANVISDNQQNGILIEGHNTLDADPENNVVQGNFIGTSVDGMTAIGNHNGVVVKSGAKKNLIGGLGLVGSTAGADVGNLISGNLNYGIAIVNSGLDLDGSPPDDLPPNNVVQGNFIGTVVTGDDALSNQNDGIWIYNSGYNLVGGVSFGNGGNLISGNLGSGVYIGTGISLPPSIVSEFNQVSGNYIGTEVDGLTGLGNAGDGVTIDEAHRNLIGGPTFATGGNVIADNEYSGVYIYGGEGPSDDNDVHGNYIGLGNDGVTARGNFRHGVELEFADGTDVAFNVIADHNHSFDSDGDLMGAGVHVYGGEGTTIRSNKIGTDYTGTLRRGNNVGVLLMGYTYNTLIGGTFLGAPSIPPDGNIIAASVFDSDLGPDSGAGVLLYNSYYTDIQANFIGLNRAGAADLGNDGDGVRVIDSSDNLIGDHYGQAGNTIAHNGAGAAGGNGISVIGDFAVGNAILANSIFSNFGLGIDLGNDGRTLNDFRDEDGTVVPPLGANNRQNFPILTDVTRVTPTSVNITGTLNSVPGNIYHIEFFANSIGDPEGRIFLGSLITGPTDGNGDVSFATPSPLLNVPPEPLEFTATATLVFQFGPPGGPALGPGFDAAPDDYYYIETSEFSEEFPEPVVDLAVTKSADQSLVDVGDTFTYTVSIANLSRTVDTTNVSVKDVLPPEVIFVMAETLSGNYDNGTGLWFVGDLDAGKSAVLTITVQVKMTAGGKTIFNKACLHTTDVPDSDPKNNCGEATVIVRTPRITDLAVSIFGVPQPVEVGNVLTYVVSAVNNGPLDSPATLVLALDAGTAFVGINVPAGWNLVSTPPANTFGGNVVLQTANLPAGNAAAVFVMDVFVDATLPNNAVLLAKAAVSTLLPESTLVNNFAFAVNTVIDDTDGTGIPPGSIGQVLIDDLEPVIELVDNRADFGAPPVQAFGLSEVRLGLTNNISFFDLNIPTANTSGIINGIVFEDANGNGSRDLNEVVLDGMVFYLTRLRADDFDESRPVATTGRDGDFRFEGLAPGVYVVRPVPNRFYAVSAPQEGFYQVVVGAERSASVTFGVRPLGGRRRPMVPSGAVPLPSRGTLALDELLPADSCLALPLDGIAAEVALRDAVFCGADREAPPLATDSASTCIDWLAPVALASLLATTLIRPRSREQDRRLAL